MQQLKFRYVWEHKETKQRYVTRHTIEEIETGMGSPHDHVLLSRDIFMGLDAGGYEIYINDIWQDSAGREFQVGWDDKLGCISIKGINSNTEIAYSVGKILKDGRVKGNIYV